jgi:hypothetical protein
MATSNGKGAPKGNQNRLTHGLVAFRNQIKRRVRRGRSLIDRRSAAGKNAVAIGDQLLADLGGEENCSTAKLMLIEMVRRDTYFLDEVDRRIFRVIYKTSATDKQLGKVGKLSNPKLIGVLYSYRQGVARNLVANLALLGLEKVKREKTLEEILNEPDGNGQDTAEET